ncbi:MAG: InlB B-repeat-containing protein [Ruminococcus sp.]|nr:InlB B-repeat-containing protein [Ruminococcus sp.]
MTVTPLLYQSPAPMFEVGSSGFTDLNSAISFAQSGTIKTVVLATDGTLPQGNYTIPSGITLLIPFDAAGTVFTNEPEVTYGNYTTPSAFRTLTMQANTKITVASGGAICANSKLSSKGQMGGYNGTPTGPDGRIHMLSGSNIEVQNNGKLYVWGYIYGDGEIEAKSGSTVYEAFQVKDWRGGSATSDVYDYAFIFSQYYIQNIEVPIKFNAGANEKLYSSVNASSEAHPISADFIGNSSSSSMFRLASGYLLKDYNETTDQVNYKLFAETGTATIAPLQISGVPMVGTVSTTDYRLPINGGMTVDVESGTTTISQDLEMLPGSELNVASGATFTIAANKSVYLFDNDNWDLYTGTAKLYAVGYSVANGTTAIRTTANLKDAKINVDGTMTIAGKLYTSDAGANITSDIGTVGTNGKIVFSAAPPTSNTTIYECYNNKTQTAVTMCPPKLHNGDDTYSETISTGTSTWKYDKSGEHWYRFLVDFKFNNTLIDRGYYCENNDTVTYDASWLTDLGASASNGTATVSGSNVDVTNVTADTIVTLTGTPAEYIPTFVLNEKQYSLYQLYTGNTITNTTTIGEDTYYIVDQASAAIAVGTAYEQPSDAAMGVDPQVNHNTITWNMSGISYNSGDPYRGVVPAGETAQEPVYIYGFYTGAVAYNSYTDRYYPTLIDAFADPDFPNDATATITMLADCGSFETEVNTQAYSIYPLGNVTLDLNGHKAVGRIINQGTFTLELGGGTFDYKTGASAAAAGYDTAAAIKNTGTLTIQDTAGGGKITADAIAKTSGVANYSSVVRNEAGASFTMTGGTLQNKPASVNNYSTALDNFGTANISNSTLTTNRGICLVNNSADAELSLTDSTVSVTTASGSYGLYNSTSAKISEIDNSHITTQNTNALYNYNGSAITSLKNTEIEVAAPTTANVYVVFNYGSTITMMDNCTITGNSGINNRNYRGSNTIAQGYNISKYGNIGTIKDSTVNVGQYALYNGGTIGTLSGSTFTASPASAQVNWPTGTAALNGNSVHCYTIVNSNLWWYDSAVWKRTDTTVKNGDTSMLQRRVDEYKTDDDCKPTIGTITGCTITANNTSTSNSYGYFALQNLGVINSIEGNTTITAQKHPNNAKTVYGYYAVRNESGGKINSISSDVTINAYNYALANIGARYAQTDVTYSTTYLASGALKSGGLATDYDYTYADVSTIGSTAATISSTSQYAILNYSKIGSVTGTISANYNVIVNAGAAGTTTGIEGTTANARAIEHRRFEGNDSSTTANEIGRDFEYTRNTTDGCYIGSIDATVTATGAGYQAVTNQGYIGTIAGTVSTPTGKATSSSTYYPLIYNGNQRQATLKQTEDYYVETNDAGATKYLREYTYDIPTIDTISCTATNPQDYTIQNCGQINNLTGSISGKTITVANEAAGPFLTRKTITFYSSATRLAASKASSEVAYEYTKQPAEITNINGATITTTGTTLALRNYGYVGEIKDSTITSTTTNTIQNGAATTNSTVTSYTSNRLDVLTGCVPNGTSSCALNYDTTQTINEEAVRAPAVINKIGAGNYISGTYFALYNMGRINEIDSGSGKTTIIYGSSRQALYNLQGCYSRVVNTDAVLTNTTGTTTNNYTYEYAPAYIGTIKNVYILGKRQAVVNGDNDATYCGETPVTIGEIGEGAEIRTSATGTYSACHNVASYAKIEKITGGVFITGSGSGIYGLNNLSTTNPIKITGGDFRGGDGTRALAINDPDNASKYTYPEGTSLSTDTETGTYHTLSSKKLTAKSSTFYYIPATYTVSFDMNGHGDAIEDKVVSQGSTVTKPDDPSAEGFEFGGWYKEDSCTNAWDFSSDKVTKDTTLYAKWTQVYTITWKDGDGNTLKTEDVASGDTPSYTGDTPTKTATAQYTYTFNNTWSPEIVPAAANATYTAQFTETTNEYTITWKDGNGDVLKTEDVAFGQTPSYSGATPTKTATAQYTYTFNNTWSPAIESVTKAATYTAQFTQTTNKYNITWVDGDGRTLTTDSVAYGETPSYSGATTPSKTPTAQYTYTFNNTWSPAIEPVTKAATYTAQFDQTVNTYTVTWVIDESAPESEVKAAVDAIIASHAQSIYDTVKAEMDYGWDMFGHAESIQMAMLDKYFGGGNTADTTYIANKIVSIVEQTTVPEGNWENAKETIVEKLLSSHDLLSDAERNSLNALAGGKTILETDKNVPYGTTPTYNGTTPTKEGDAQYSYTFSGWSPEIKPVTEDVTYAAQFTQAVNTYTVTWVIDESAPESEVKAAVDALIAEIAQTVYNDARTEGDMAWNMGWFTHEYLVTMHLEAGHVGSNESSAYIAKRIIEIVDNSSADFSAADALWNSCKDTVAADFAAFSGYSSSDTGTVYSGLTASQKSSLEALAGGKTILRTDKNVPYGTMPDFGSTDPTKEGDAQYSYTFTGWSPEIEPVTEDVTYAAQFTQTTNKYTITWVDGNGDTLKTEQVEYGQTPSYTGDTPTKTADAQYTYSFSNSWLPAIEPVTQNAEYTAQFSTTTNRYNITWLNDDGTEIDTTSVAYGDTPTHVAPEKESDGTYTYDFAGWTPSIETVTQDTSYQATYNRSLIFAGHLLTLDGDIGTSFFINLNGQYEPEDCEVEFSWNDQTKTVALSDITPETQKDKDGNDITVYRATVNVAPKEMNDQITAAFKVDGKTVSTETYTAATYPRRVINEYPDGDLKDLCKALLNYASKAQEQFVYPPNESGDGVDESKRITIDYTAPEVDTTKLVDYHTGTEDFSSFGLTGYVGSTMQLNYMTTYSLFFRISNKSVAQSLVSVEGSPCPVTATIGNGEDLQNMAVSSYFVDDTLGNKDVFLRVDIENIAAADITEDITVTFNGSKTFTVNTGAYINSALINGNETLRATITALCDYNNKAKIYFDNHR